MEQKIKTVTDKVKDQTRLVEALADTLDYCFEEVFSAGRNAVLETLREKCTKEQHKLVEMRNELFILKTEAGYENVDKYEPESY